MFNRIKSLLVLSALVTSTAYANDVEQMVKNADKYRLESKSAKVVSLVSLYENEQLDKTREYSVYTRPNRESLVLFKSQVEAGQKMLMLGDNYWLVMPKSRRPIRITPMQKLLGEASVGDISTLTWSEDYQPSLISTEMVESEGQQIETNQLQLKATTKGASYHRIDLWLNQANDFPVKADLYLRSGKLAKQAWFTPGERDGQTRVVAMTLLDQIQPAKKTVIEYQEVTEAALDDKYYNPAYLTRNALSEL
ncbi:outer membrane lipoprotein-sorting protein [Vibrio ouci]|uniref:Outer membrane lipoprotein-sorting protein n=1 Tax=Vibrio ouci TaxID=2499078 RepID=A0A4Y8W9C7_9VIBR|nr:outer membrane lipoprotein-sorting protein [Vibrio ouci]TFH89529.1 outer membrane lipoprotein-sorting protein [Vibrio ouci]